MPTPIRPAGVRISEAQQPLSIYATQRWASSSPLRAKGLLERAIDYEELQPRSLKFALCFLKFGPCLSRYVIQQIVGITAKFLSFFSPHSS
jgi:hypothetical protein